MGEQANTIPPSGYRTLQGSDFVKGLGYTLFGVITGIILFMLSQDHWPTWVEWRPVIYTSASTIFVYIGKNYFTNNEGKMFKNDSPVTTVPTAELNKVIDKAESNEEAVG